MPIEGPAESVTERLTERPTERLTTVGDEPSTVTLTINTTDQPTRVPIELRVHGVTGTPAEQMLDRQIIGHVAGDGEAGFFRPRAEYGAANTHGPGGARLEAYRWGNLTAGAAARAFWLLMLPFTLANVAIWMRPPAVGVSRWLLRGLSRVFALTMTATFTLMAVGLALDLVAWQCAATPENRCIDARPWMQFAFTDFFEPTGRRLALTALVPIAVVCLLWYLARRTWARYESFAVPDVSPQGDGIATPTFWDGRAQVGRLRALHVAAGFAVVDAVLIYVLIRREMKVDSYAGVDLGGIAPSAVVAAGRAIAVGVVAVLALCVLLLFSSRMIDRGSKSVGARKIANGLRAISILLTLLTLGYALVPRGDWRTSGALPGYADAVVALFAGQTAILALLMLIILPMRRRCKGAMFGGFGMPIIASLALGLGAAFAAGVAYRVADFLDRGAVPSPANFDTPSTTPRLEPPISYQWAGFGVLVVLAVVVMVLLWNRLVTRPGLRRKARPDTDADYPDGRRRDRGRANTIDRAIATARMTDHVSRTFATAWVVLAAAGAVSTGLALAKIGPVQLADSNTVGADILSGLTNLGTYLISLFAFALVLLGIQTYRNERVRRTVGVIWDLATFWPRAAHPLAPPCYAERVVPELVHRSTWLANEQGGVVLSGHSQGSVLAAAAVLQLPDAALERTSLLTYGSPLCRLYMKAFPNYWGQQVVDKVGAAVADQNGSPRWINLWRRTDPIGGAVGVGDRRLVDPQGFNSPPGDRVPPPVAGHSGYQVTVDFADAVKDLLSRMPSAPSAAPPPPIPQERRPA